MEIAGKAADFVTDSVGLDGMLGHESTEMVKTPGDETTTHGYSEKAMEIAEARNNVVRVDLVLMVAIELIQNIVKNN